MGWFADLRDTSPRTAGVAAVVAVWTIACGSPVGNPDPFFVPPTAFARATVLWLLVGPACNDLPTAIEPLRAERLTIIGGNCIVGSSLRVAVGGTCEVEAEARDASNQVVVENFSWSTEAPATASVSPKPGFDTMIADVSGLSVGLTTLRVEISGRPELAPQEVALTVFDPLAR